MYKKITRFFLVIFGMAVIASLCYHEKKYTETIVINEVCTNNFSNCSDEFGNYLNWVEIYNPADEPIPLGGYQITDKGRKDKFVFEDIVLGGKQYLIVFFSNKPIQYRAEELYAGYEISGEEVLFLLDEGENIVDYVEIPVLGVNQAYARIDDGSAKWQIQNATPFESNNGQEEIACSVANSTMRPAFSKESGFYEGEFEITLSMQTGVKADIYYTLDGSIPTRESTRYTEPILIEDASNHPNFYSTNTDIGAQGKSEIGEIVVPEQLIDKATVVRAVAYNNEGEAGEVVTATYFVGLGNKSEYMDLEVISLVSEPDNLFDYDIGIYVAGRIGDGIQVTDDWLWQNANYRKRGKSAEREVYVEYFAKDHMLKLSKKCGIRIRGNATRAYQQKSFNLFAREEYDGSNQF